jgi:FAD/FMN-containing dehydrogenase
MIAPNPKSCFAMRAPAAVMLILGMLATPDGKDLKEPTVKAVRELSQSELAQAGEHGKRTFYANYEHSDFAQSAQSLYGEDVHKRLQAIKAKYDPENFFRGCKNILPASAASDL